jgi:hypothetical protein
MDFCSQSYFYDPLPVRWLDREGKPLPKVIPSCPEWVQVCALIGIQIANRKALQAILLEGLHPVFLTLFM